MNQRAVVRPVRLGPAVVVPGADGFPYADAAPFRPRPGADVATRPAPTIAAAT